MKMLLKMVSGEALDTSSAHTCSNGKILHFRAAVMWRKIVSQWLKILGTMSLNRSENVEQE